MGGGTRKSLHQGVALPSSKWSTKLHLYIMMIFVLTTASGLTAVQLLILSISFLSSKEFKERHNNSPVV